MNIQMLKSERVAVNLTQEKIAKKVGVTAKTYNRKELGLVPFNANEIKKLKYLLNLSPEKLDTIFFTEEVTDCISEAV